jgi:galactokinase
MAITADVLVAVSVVKSEDRRVRIANVDAEKYPSRDFEVSDDGEVSIDASSHEWTNYFKSGLRGASDIIKKIHSNSGEHSSFVGMDVLVDGNVPAGGGLSSSAAFVCASSLAVLNANGMHSVDKKTLIETAMVSERAVGVNSGGYAKLSSENIR